MSRLPIFSLLALPFVLACLVWLIGRPASSPAPWLALRSAARPSGSTPEPQRLPRFLELPRAARQEVPVTQLVASETAPAGRLVAPEEALDSPAPRAAAVRVHGQVREAGRLLAAYELAFHPMSEGLDGDEEDWDITDQNGHYEVELDPGSYAVLSDQNGELLTKVHVPEGVVELPLDLDLAP